jgi:hypothetical protein
MSVAPPAPGWWQASDGGWYPPTSRPGTTLPPPPDPTTQPDMGTPVVANPPIQVAPQSNTPGEQKLNTVSIVAFVSAFVVPVAVVPIILGVIGDWQIKHSGGKERGHALALWAVALGFIEVVGFVILLVALHHHPVCSTDAFGNTSCS